MSLLAKLAAASLKAKIAVSCAAVAVLGTATVVTTTIINQEEVYRVLKVFEMSGSSVVSRESVGELDAYVGMNLESGDLLSVGEESNLRLSLDNDKYILLDQGTVMKLNAEGDRNDSKTSIELMQGTILNEITKPLSANSTYEVATPKATMAVRGTSFVVSVDENDDGSYTIDVSALNGRVEAMLLDSKGDPTDKKVTIAPDQRATIQTDPNKETGNPASVDGFSSFVIKDKDGNITKVPEGENPIYDINYDELSDNVKTYAINSNETNLMVLESDIVRKLMGVREDSEQTSESSETEAPVTEETSFPASTVTKASSGTPAAVTTYALDPVTEIAYLPVIETAAPESNNVTERAVSDTVSSSTAFTSTESEEAQSEENTLETLPPDTPTEEETLSEENSVTETSASSVSETEPINSDSSTSSTTRPPLLLMGPSPMPFIPGTTTAVTEPAESETTTTTVTSVTSETTSETEAEVFTISFMNGTKLVHSEQVKSGDAISSIPDVPSETGKSGSWSYNGAKFDPSMSITGNIVVNAVYSDIICTVTFIDATGKALTPVEITYGQTVTEADFPEVTVPAGKELNWINSIDKSEFASSATITADTTFTAEFTDIIYTVTFNDAEGNKLSSIELTYNQTVAASGKEMPEAGTGYKWVIDGTDTEFTASTTVTGNMTVNAEHKPIAVTFKDTSETTYYFNSGETVETSDYKTLPTITEGCVWLIDGIVPDTIFKVTDKITGDLSVSAVKKCTVTFTAEDGVTGVPETITVYAGRKIPADHMTVPEKTGYTFKNWVYGTEKTVFDPSEDVTSDLDLTADFTINEYTVTMIDSGSNSTEYTIEHGKSFSTSSQTMPGAGAGYKWVSDDGNFTATTPVTGDITVTAEQKPIKVTFKDKSGEYYFDSGEKFSGSGYTMPEAGRGNAWLIDKTNVDTEFTADTKITKDLTLTAVSVSTYTIKNMFDTGNEVVEEGKCINGKQITLTPSTSVSGKSFAGWGRVTSGGYTGYDNLNSSGSVTLTPESGSNSMEFRAVYKSTATVKWNNPDGTTVKSETHELFTDNVDPSKIYVDIYDAPSELSGKYENIYYTVGGTKKELTSDTVSFSGDVTFTAENLRSFTVKYHKYLDLSDVYENLTVPYGTSLLSALMDLEYSQGKLQYLGPGLTQEKGWAIDANKWKGSGDGHIPVTDDMKVTKDLDESYNIIEYKKQPVKIYKESSSELVCEIFIMANHSLAMINYPSYLDDLLVELGGGYDHFETPWGDTFTKDTIVTEYISIYAKKSS